MCHARHTEILLLLGLAGWYKLLMPAKKQTTPATHIIIHWIRLHAPGCIEPYHVKLRHAGVAVPGLYIAPPYARKYATPAQHVESTHAPAGVGMHSCVAARM